MTDALLLVSLLVASIFKYNLSKQRNRSKVRPRHQCCKPSLSVDGSIRKFSSHGAISPSPVLFFGNQPMEINQWWNPTAGKKNEQPNEMLPSAITQVPH